MILFPSGYGTGELTLSALVDKHLPPTVTEPEYRIRLINWLASTKGEIGLGDILPRSKDHSVSAASKANKSFHQLQKFTDGTEWACAIDLVVRNPGKGHSSGLVPWDKVPVQGSADAKKWGVHINVSGEPWHIQPVEIDGHTSWVSAGRKRPVAGYDIPGEQAPPPPPPAPSKRATLSITSPRTAQSKQLVREAQTILNKANQKITVDGWFGSQTDRAVRNVQKFFGLEIDGIVGPKTWALLDAINVWAG